MKLLGIDYGTKKVGVALSDIEGNLAFPRCVLENTITLPAQLTRIAKDEEISGIVIGQSVDYEGIDNQIMKDIYRFKKELERGTELPVYFESEVLTTAEARRVPQASDAPRSRKQKKRKMLDASAAALILQQYIDKTKKHAQ